MTTDASTFDPTLDLDPPSELRPFGDSTSPLDLLRDRGALFDAIDRGDDLAGISWRGLLTAVAGSAVFGLAVGVYAGTVGQALASLLKMPSLLVCTTLLTFPSFFVLQSWRAPRPLDWRRAMALLATMLGATGLVWGALAPPVLFLVASIRNYDLAQFLSLLVGAFGGLVGLAVLVAGYRRLCDPLGNIFRSKFLVLYFVIFGAVGAQLAWMLRPYVGSPSLPFQLFRSPGPTDPGSIFEFLLSKLFGA